jgi:hypothetical protein
LPPVAELSLVALDEFARLVPPVDANPPELAALGWPPLSKVV